MSKELQNSDLIYVNLMTDIVGKLSPFIAYWELNLRKLQKIMVLRIVSDEGKTIYKKICQGNKIKFYPD